ncbi:hypothetical protein QE152_g8373 [Popillia japonica]|uniref:Uncharacterized protein n=1 Tax=Popillia japonica TaxID=7064 RepID=A0AAW1MCA4_POPJA
MMMMMSLGEAITLYTAIKNCNVHLYHGHGRNNDYTFLCESIFPHILYIAYVRFRYRSILVLLLLMDYFRWIANFKWIVILVQFITTIVLTSTYFLMIDYMEYFLHTTVFWILAEFFSFVLLYLIQDDVKVLQKRRVIDDESHLRRSIINTFLRTKALAGIVFALESIIELLFNTTPTFGSCALGVTQIDSTLFIIILFKLDPNLRTNFVKVIFADKYGDLFGFKDRK